MLDGEAVGKGFLLQVEEATICDIIERSVVENLDKWLVVCCYN